MGLGGGLDISGYSGKGLFDFGPTVSGFIAWTGSYPRVYRLSGQLTRLYREHRFGCFHADAVTGSSACDEGEIVNLTSVELSAVWFDREAGSSARYAGVAFGVLNMGFEDDPDQWGLLFSPIFGVRFGIGRWYLSVESGGKLVVAEDTEFAVIPIRVFLEL
jgi:hypothetical protein